MSVDLRTRIDGELTPIDPAAFFSTQLPEALEASRALLEPGADWLRLRPLCVDTDGELWTLAADARRIAVTRGAASDAARVRLTRDDLTRLVHDQATPMTFFTGGTLDMPAGGLGDLLDWWLVLRGALDGRRVHTSGSLAFEDRDGSPLDLKRSFRLDDSREEMSHFLHEAGFLHLRAAFEASQMAAVSRDMDRAAPRYADGDGRSWWATTKDGRQRLVRMQGFDEHSAATRELLADARFLGLAAIPGDGHHHQGLEGNRIEALLKPIGVVKGISDVPWHKDCSLGRHSYECCSMTCGISVTGADATSGQLRVVAGSHRVLMRPALLQDGHGLPEIDLPTSTGDLTLHLSCTLHMSQPPRERERRVMYTGFRLPGRAPEAAAAARARLRAVREAAHTTVSQEPGYDGEESPGS